MKNMRSCKGCCYLNLIFQYRPNVCQGLPETSFSPSKSKAIGGGIERLPNHSKY